ncbi:Autophagy-related protein 27 [Yarrowia sp. B02]|nr:Autophagy-related protein 27 [Yarrowia sp. B02]
MKLAILGYLSLASASCQFAVGGKNYDLSAISGPHTVSSSLDTPPSQRRLDFVLDPCDSLKEDRKKGRDEQCPENTIVCGLGYIKLPNAKDFELAEVMPFGSGSGPQYQPAREGDGLYTSYGNPWGSEKLEIEVNYVCADKEEGPKLDPAGLNFYSITWKTPAACETSSKKPEDPKKPDEKPDPKKPETDPSNSWGWFTWLFIIIVLGVAVYIIGNAWINYDRYGNAGVDLLPHADSLRDVPYLIRDLIQKIVGTFTGSSRTGYSAV